jgi:Ca2+-binding EF-hand superfamily protein
MAHQSINRKLGLGIVMACSLTLTGYAVAGDHGGKEKAEAQFQKMDSNADGKVSQDEHTTGAKAMFDTMDADKDGKVTAAEMDAAHDQMHKAHAMDKGDKGDKGAKGAAHKAEMRATEKIKVVDTNGDGTLTAEEHAAGSKLMFGKMDTDKDGFLSKDELTKGHAKMLHKKRRD